MAQDGTTAGGSSYTIDNVTFPVGRTKLQSIFDAIRSTNIGNTAPDLVAGQFWIDNNTPSTTVWTLYLYDGTDNISFATIDTINNTVNFLDSTFDLINDTTPQLGGDLSSNGNNINFGDNDKAQFGAGNDLQIYHDGSNSKIKELGTGQLILDSNGAGINFTKSDAEYMARMYTDGAVELYYDNSKKIETSSTGATVTGNITATGNLTSLGIDDNATSTAITIDSSERVGIGETDNSTYVLGKKLVIGELENNDGITLKSSTTTHTNYLAFADADGGLSSYRGFFGYNHNDNSFRLGTDSSERMRITSAGLVGIGTSTPYSILGGRSLGVHNSSGASELNLLSSTTGFGALYFGDATSGNSRYAGYIEYKHDDDYFRFATNSIERMRLTSTGLGIGTSSPSERLHVNGHIVGNSLNIPSNTSSPPSGVTIHKPANDTMAFRINSTEKMRLTSTGLGIGTTSPQQLINIQSTSNAKIRYAYSSTVYGEFGRKSNGVHEWSSYENGGDLSFGTTQVTGSTTERMRIEANGNVGIGTSSPSLGKLTVSGSGDQTLVVESTDSDSQIRLRIVGEGDVFVRNRDGDLTFENTSERMRIDSSGNVGIGTTSPDSILDLTSTPNNNFIHFNSTTGGSNGDIIGGFEVNNTGGTIGKLTVHRETTNSSGYMAFQTGTTEKMRITNAGKVGINTSAPDTTFHVGNSTDTSEYITLQSSGDKRLTFKGASATRADIGVFESNHNDFVIRAGSSAGIRFVTNNENFSGGGANPIKIDTSGNLGINTNSPSQKLDVVGSIEVSDGIYIGGTGTANKLDDYEEGTFTVSNATGASSGTLNFLSSKNELSYIKIGNLVNIVGLLEVYSVTGTMSGNYVTLSGLPFTCADLTDRANNNSACVIVSAFGNSNSAQAVAGQTSEGVTDFYVYKYTADGEWITNAQNGTTLRFNFCYRAN